MMPMPIKNKALLFSAIVTFGWTSSSSEGWNPLHAMMVESFARSNFVRRCRIRIAEEKHVRKLQAFLKTLVTKVALARACNHNCFTTPKFCQKNVLSFIIQLNIVHRILKISRTGRYASNEYGCLSRVTVCRTRTRKTPVKDESWS